MSSRSDISNSQDTASSGSAFRDDVDDLDVVNEMCDATDQMGGHEPEPAIHLWEVIHVL